MRQTDRQTASNNKINFTLYSMKWNSLCWLPYPLSSGLYRRHWPCTSSADLFKNEERSRAP